MSGDRLDPRLRSGSIPALSLAHPHRPRLWTVVASYWAAFSLLHLAASVLGTPDGLFVWSYPAALSVTLLLVYGPKMLPVVFLAPLPVDLWLHPMGLGPWAILASSASFACGQVLAVQAFRMVGLSPRLRRIKDVAGFLALACLGPLLAALPVYALLRATSALPGSQLGEGLRTLLFSQILGALALGPALLLWVRPMLAHGWITFRPDPAIRPMEYALQGLALAVTAALVVRFSEPGTLHLKYLLFFPMIWVVVRSGLRAAGLAFPFLGLVLTGLILRADLPSEAHLGIQTFLAVLFGTTLFLGSAVDVQQAALQVLDRRSGRLGQLLKVTGAIPWEMDLETGRCGHLGQEAGTILGWPQRTWTAQPFWGGVIHPEDQPAFGQFLLETSRPDGDHQLEFRLRTPEGGEHWVRAAGGVEPIQGQGQRRILGFLFDIHEHKKAEQNALQASLKEKDLLLREIHHRVKNNLQVVSSLLRLQASTQEDPALQRALQEAQERIQAIALIHQKLKHAPDFSQLDLPGYVQTLAERLVRSYASVPALIDLKVSVAKVDIGPDAHVPLGLILNELVANALQHAFPTGEGGALDIEIYRDATGWIALRVTDSGRGLPEAVDLVRGGLGFQLVQALTDQLSGVLELERRRGASFLLRFPATRHP